ncbi:MAG: redoxin family protein [Planctomycetaceae bacterium]
MSMRQSAELLFVTLIASYAAFPAVPSIAAEPAPEGSAAVTGVSGSTDLRQHAKLLRPADHGVGRFIADLTFPDLNGNQRSLGEFRNRKLTVVAMTSTSCPLSRKYRPTLVELAKNYSAKDVQFIAVNCFATDKLSAMQAAAQTFGETAVYVHDPDEHLGAARGKPLTTTDVIVLDQARTVYHGAIDDQYGIGYALDAPRHSFLAAAIDSLLAGKVPEIAATAAPGCLLDHDSASAVAADLTYHNRISRILQQHCVECHRSGGVGPFALDTYADVVAHAPMIRDVVDRGTMPPWFAAKPDSKHDSVWANDRSLSESDRHDLLAWINAERTEGDVSEAPVPRKFADEWTIGIPDYVIQIPEPIEIKATGTMPYQFVKAETTLEQDTWIQGYEILPTDRSVVHHVLVNVHEKGSGRVRDREEGVGGYWAAYVPGNAGQLYPQGFAKLLPAGATVSFQIHYTPNGEATQDQLKMGLIFADSDPQYVVTTIPLADVDLNIPPQAENHVETITRPVPADINVMAFMAHMHVRGKAFKFELISPDGTTETLLDIPRYDFNWQIRYGYREPRTLPKGSRVKVTGIFDNSQNNPANPDPTETVHWGEQTHEEMLIGYIETYAPLGAPRPTMMSHADAGGRLFTLLDANGDEALEKDEAMKAIDRVPALKNSPLAVDILFNRIDEDQDGKLSLEEFNKLRQELRGRRDE